MFANTVFPAANSTSGIFGALIVDVLDYTNTNKNKTIRALGAEQNNAGGFMDLDSGAYYSTNPVTSIQISNGPFVVNSSFALYGIK
jgi:hypothetical protein